MGDEQPRLSIRGVGRTFLDGRNERAVLSEVHLDVMPGEMVALMGPSGSGKTTLVMLAAGLDRPTSGQVLIEGVHLSALGAGGLAEVRRTRIGYVEQKLNLLAALTAAENVALPLELGGVSARRARVEAIAALDDVGLVELADQGADTLSGGEQQRVAIARALVGTRRLLLADEPTGSLDSLTGESIMRLLRRRCDDGDSVLLTTHDAAHAAWADRVVFLRDGMLVDEAAPRPDAISFDTATPIDLDGLGDFDDLDGMDIAQ